MKPEKKQWVSNWLKKTLITLVLVSANVLWNKHQSQ